jgi:hypothetical protein
MGRLTTIFAASLMFVSAHLNADEDWDVLKGKHFVVYHHQQSDFAEKVLQHAEDYYGSIASDLGFKRHDDFWTWDNRVAIRIYSSRRDFMRATGAPKWAAGKASYTSKEISTFNGSGDFLGFVLPHELTHLIFRDFVGFTGEIPLWLDEGVAQWEEMSGKRTPREHVMRPDIRKRLMSLSALTRLDAETVRKEKLERQFYAQSASVVGYMIEKHSSDRFRKFCGQLRDGKELDEALRFTYPEEMRNIEDLEQAWKEYLETPE